MSWPAEIDVFLAIGELALYVAYLDCWPARQRIWPWATALIGLGISVAGTSATSSPNPATPSSSPTASPPPPAPPTRPARQTARLGQRSGCRACPVAGRAARYRHTPSCGTVSGSSRHHRQHTKRHP